MSNPTINVTDPGAFELLSGCIDCFCYGGFDVELRKLTSPVPEDRKYHRKRWYLYQRGKYAGHSFKKKTEAIVFIDSLNA